MAARSDDEVEQRVEQLMTPPPVLTPFMPSLDNNSTKEEEEEMVDSLTSQGFDVETFTRRHLNCPKCGQYYNDPRTLPCLCSYCKTCLEETARQERAEKLTQIQEEEEEDVSGLDSDDGYLESLRSSFNLSPCSNIEEEEEEEDIPQKKHIDIDNFYCPRGCQATTGVKIGEEGQVYQLPEINLFIKNIVDTVRLKEELPQGRMWCQNCDLNSVAIAICNNKDCANIPLCAICLDAHLRAVSTKHHEVISASTKYTESRRGDGRHGDSRHGDESGGGGDDDSKDEEPPDEWKNFGRRPWHCHRHPDQLVDRYCYDHEETLCMKCQLNAGAGGHWRNCKNIINTEECVEVEEGLLRHLLLQVDELHRKIKTGIDNIELMKVVLIQDKDWILNTITERCAYIVDSIEQQRIDLTDQTKRICNLKMEQLNESRDCLVRISDTFTRSTEFIRDSMKMAIPTEFMFLKEGFHQRLNYLQTHYANCHNDIPNDLNNRIHLKLNDNFKVENAIGQVHGTPFVKAFTIEKFPQEMRARNCYPFEIICRDICQAPLLGVSLPPLKATIKRPNEEPIECFVRPDTKRGTYSVYMYPATSGSYMISVFNVQNGPFEDLFVRRGLPRSFRVQH